MTPPLRRRLTLRRALFYVWAALVLVNLLVLGAYTVPRTLQERNVVRRAEQLHGEVRAAAERNRALRRRSDVSAQNDADVGRFYRGVVGTREQTLLPVLAEIDAVARELQLAPGNQTFDAKPVEDAPLVRFRVTLPVGGSYRQVVAFLDRLERSSHFVTVDEVRLRERLQEVGSAELNVSLSTYFHAPGAESGAPPKEKETRRAR